MLQLNFGTIVNLCSEILIITSNSEHFNLGLQFHFIKGYNDRAITIGTVLEKINNVDDNHSINNTHH